MTNGNKHNEEKHTGFEDIPVLSAAADASPEKVSYDPERVKALDRHFLGLVKNKDLQGASYLLARKGMTFACKSMGSLDFEKGGRYQPDSIRHIASISKLFTSVAIIQLYEQGRLNIFDPVANHLKEFDTDLHRKIQPWHLLTHTSGLRADGGYFSEPYMQAWNEKLNNWIEAYLAGPVQSKPGEKWSYSSTGFCVLAEIIARITGLDITEYADKYIFKPLKMKDTAYFVPEEKKNRVCVACEWERKHMPDSVNLDRKGYPPPGGNGIFSTLHDMFRMGQCLLNNGTLDGARILSRKAIDFMSTNQLHGVPAYHWGGEFADFRYGVGVVVKKDDFGTWNTFGHEGAGFSGLYIDRDSELVYMFFVPSDIGWTAESVDNPRAIVWSGLLEE